jgi:PucR family transcriptional regulator, purine catabolism regulatory protein
MPGREPQLDKARKVCDGLVVLTKQHMRLTLRDVLDQSGLGLKLRTDGGDVASIAVHGAHSIEVADPLRWLPERWIMLTTGVRLRGRRDEQRRLIAQLSEGGIAALGFGERVISRHVPEALLDEAERCGFPVFSVPFETGFREIISFVNQSLVSTELHVMQRVVSLQEYLLDALHDEHPQSAILGRLVSVLAGAQIALLDGHGQPVFSSGPLAESAFGEVAREPVGTRELRHRGHWGVAAPVQQATGLYGWLVAVLVEGETSRALVKPVTRVAARLLSLPMVSGGSVVSRRRARRRLAAQLLDLPGEPQAGRLRDALSDIGVDFATPARVAVLSTVADQPAPAPDTMAAFVERMLDRVGVPHVSGPWGNGVLVLAQDDLSDLEDWLLGARMSGREVMRAGISHPVGGLGEVTDALDVARLALSAAHRRRQLVVLHEHVDSLTLMLSALTDQGVHERLGSALAPLAEHPRLLETLRVYFESDCVVSRAADALRVHPNSMRYRLAKIEQLLGCSLSVPETIARVYLALLDERTGLADRGSHQPARPPA